MARSQHGLFTAEQAIAAGMTRGQIRYRVKVGRWEAMGRAVYRPFGAVGPWEQRVMAACLGAPGVASHRSAGVLWHIPGCDRQLVEITALRHRRQQRCDVVCHESYLLEDRCLTALEGIPATTVHRTIADLASVLTHIELEVSVDDIVRRGLSNVARLRAELERGGQQRPGRARLDRVLAQREVGTGIPESPLETRFLVLLREARLPKPTVQARLEIGDGRPVRIDCCYVDRRIAIELDGAAFHTSRPHRQRDLDRQNRLVTAGWRVLRFTWEDVHERPDSVVQTLRGILAIAA